MRFTWLVLLSAFYALLAFTVAGATEPQPQRHLQDSAFDPDFNITSLLANWARTSGDSTRPERRWFGGTPPAPASAADFARYACKGKKMLAQMSYSDQDVGAMLPVPQNTAKSPWTYYNLAPWGYQVIRVPPDYRNLEAGGNWGVTNFLRHIGVSDKFEEEQGLWKGVGIRHRTDMDPRHPLAQGLTYQGPDGYSRRYTYCFHYIAVTDGAIMVQNTRNARYAADLKYPPAGSFPDWELPAMRQLSDMISAAWDFLPPGQKTNIQFYMPVWITNAMTQSLIVNALNSLGQQLTPNPTLIDPATDEGAALIGSPLGAAFAHFLITHKNTVGMKTVTAIYVFESENANKSPVMLFYVKPVVTPVPRPVDPTPAPNPGSGGSLSGRAQKNRDVLRVHTLGV